MLLVASYVFYGAWDWRYLSLILLSTTVDYFCGLGLDGTDDRRRRKLLVTISIVFNLSLLGVFKYYDFFAENFAVLMSAVGLEVHPYFLNVALPIGISFYTFQTMSYTIDVYRRKLPPARNFLDFALYVSFFPQLIAGPIERGTRLLPQILNKRQVTPQKIYRGIYLFIWGFFLKVFIADNLAVIVEPVFGANGPYDGAYVLLATYAFSFQIFSDFAGYSFMAIGLALMMGIELMENFRRPYFSKNIADFWRRWHISLSSWFRDYVFSPFYMYLGKRPIIRNLPLKVRHWIAFFVALFIAEFMLGLWHGAGWNYAMFGVYHAAMIWAYYGIRKYWDRMNYYLQIFLTWQLACVGWLIFAAPTLGQAVEMMTAVITDLSWPADGKFSGQAVQVFVLIAIVVVKQVLQEIFNDSVFILAKLPAYRVAYLTVLVLSMLLLGNVDQFDAAAQPARPFIYFQF